MVRVNTIPNLVGRTPETARERVVGPAGPVNMWTAPAFYGDRNNRPVQNSKRTAADLDERKLNRWQRHAWECA